MHLRYLKNFKSISPDNNLITTLPEGLLKNNHQLINFMMESNKLEKVNGNIFQSLKNPQNLHFHGNEIVSIGMLKLFYKFLVMCLFKIYLFKMKTPSTDWIVLKVCI